MVSRPLDVQAAPEIDARIASEVTLASQILDGLNSVNFLASPYLVSAIYYHDGFLADFPADRTTAAPERRIIAQIDNLLTPAAKARFVALLHQYWSQIDPSTPARFVEPVVQCAVGGGSRAHRYAIDLFTSEGADVRSVTRGIVLLADGDWTPDTLFSTTSRNGGNAVIVFSPDNDRFYRYCHMSAVQVAAGDLLEAGQVIGKVGHTGVNASEPGHGHHLHLEVNEYADGRVKAIDYRRLRTMVRQWRAPSASAARIASKR